MPSGTPPVIVVVGTGFIAPIHLEALRRLGLRVKGVVGSSPARAAEAARRWGLAVGYPDYAAALADPEVTAVHLASPNRDHCAQVLAALAAGKHVVCEKPLALTTAESSVLVAAAAAHPQLVTAVNYNVRFYPLVLQARALVRQGAIGPVYHLHGSYLQDWLLQPTDFNWRVQASTGGALRAVGDVGTHWLDLITFVSGLEIEAVMADLQTVHPVRQRPAHGPVETFAGAAGRAPRATLPVPVDTEDYGSILLRFRGGARGACMFSQVAAGRKNCLRFEIAGGERSLAWNSERPDELWVGARGLPNQLLPRDPALLDASVAPYTDYPGGHAEGYPDTFKQLYRAIYADVARGGPSPAPEYATFADGHRELCLCAAVLASDRSGTWARVPD